MNIFSQEIAGQTALRAMPLLLLVLCVLVIAYRYYSAFLAAKVAALNDSRVTPAHALKDGQNYHPTNKWVLFGHHFAAISGAGPLIGPVLAIQYGYMPGLLWLVIGVCLAGAVQDMLVLAASVRRGGKSLAQIAYTELGRPAAIATSVAILAIVVIALAGLGFVVVKALGGEEVKLAKGTEISVANSQVVATRSEGTFHYLQFPPGCAIRYPGMGDNLRPEAFELRTPLDKQPTQTPDGDRVRYRLGDGTVQMIPGSSWGTFTIACTIPIALLVSLWMYKIRPGKVTEASALGAIGVLFATVAGSWIPGSTLEPFFALSKNQTIIALCAYGFIASVLPVWLLLCPRDYISSFLKIGTIALLVLGVIVANPPLRCPPINHVFIDGGPTFAGNIFPFVFICIMCGAISGFHALVASGTTPKMIDKETDIRLIGYGSMLMEGLVGIVALFAAASLPVDLYYDINVDLDKAPRYQAQLDELYKEMKIDRAVAGDKLHALGVDNVAHLNIDDADLARLEELVGGESLRGRTGGAVTLAVGMSRILTTAMYKLNISFEGVVKYWYHFAIMFEALFILTTIDTGTRIARFLLQETLGKVFPRFERPDWIPGSILATAIVTAGWGGLVATGSISTIWPMFGIANQLLAAMALALVTTLLINTGRGRYTWATIIPMTFVIATTMTAGVTMSRTFMGWIVEGESRVVTGALSLTLTVFVMISVGTVLLLSITRWIAIASGMIKIPGDTAG